MSGHTPWSEIRKTKAELHAALDAALAHVEALKEAGEGLLSMIAPQEKGVRWSPEEWRHKVATWREAVSASAAGAATSTLRPGSLGGDDPVSGAVTPDPASDTIAGVRRADLLKPVER